MFALLTSNASDPVADSSVPQRDCTRSEAKQRHSLQFLSQKGTQPANQVRFPSHLFMKHLYRREMRIEVKGFQAARRLHANGLPFAVTYSRSAVRTTHVLFISLR
jgi:hypothetical protein